MCAQCLGAEVLADNVGLVIERAGVLPFMVEELLAAAPRADQPSQHAYLDRA
jgi:hypothetical protein